jgi:drug/metabolite transporter (DMT)-like permease
MLFYAVAQGAQFMALAYLPAITVGLLLNFSTVVIAVPGIVFLAERPGLWQWGGVVW